MGKVLISEQAWLQAFESAHIFVLSTNHQGSSGIMLLLVKK